MDGGRAKPRPPESVSAGCPALRGSPSDPIEYEYEYEYRPLRRTEYEYDGDPTACGPERSGYTQENIVSQMDYGWQPIEPHEIVLEGFDGVVKITVESLLATPATLARPDALGMTTTVRIDRRNSSPSIDISTNHAYYGSLASLSESVTAFRSGRATDIAIAAVGLRLRLYEHHFGARSGTCVAGDVSDVLEIEKFPWPAEDIGDRLLRQRESSFHLRFAFQTSVVDPPFVTRFADHINQLERYVQSLGAS